MFLLVCILLYPFVVIFYCCLQLNCLQLVCNFLQSPPIFQFVLVCFHLQRFFILHCSYNVCFHLLLVCSFKVIFHLFPFVVPLSIIEQSPKIMELLFVVTLYLFVVLLAKCVVSGTTNCLGGEWTFSSPSQSAYSVKEHNLLKPGGLLLCDNVLQRNRFGRLGWSKCPFIIGNR